MKKLLTILFSVFISITLVSFMNTNTILAWGSHDGPSSWNCDNVDDAIDYYRDQASSAGSPREEDDWLDLADRAKDWKENNCDDDSCAVTNGFSRDSLIIGGSVVHDYHGFEVCWRTYGGEYVFCTEPDARSTLCENLSGSWSNTQFDLAMAFAAWGQCGKSHTDYLAMQIIVWSEYGHEGVVPGYSTSWAWNHLLPNLYNSSQWQNEDVDFNQSVVDVSIGDTINVADSESNLHRGYWSVNTPANTATSKTGDSVTSTINDPYPLARTITATSSKDNPELSRGTLSGNWQSFSNPKWQDQAVMRGYADLGFLTHENDSFKMATRTGNVTINKTDEFGDPGVAGNQFSIYMTPDNPNYGTSCDAGDGLFKLQNGMTVFESGKVYSDNGSNGVNISNGTASLVVLNGLLPIGDYYVKEVAVTNEYELSTEEIPFTVTHGGSVSVGFENIMRTVTFSVYKYDVEEEYRKINNAEFTVYDVTGHWKPAEEKDVENMYFVKVNKSTNLRDLFLSTDTEIQSNYGEYPMNFSLAHYDNGTIDTDDIFTATDKSGLVYVTVTGGGYQDLWCKYPNGKDVYLNDAWNPYDIDIFTDAECIEPLNIDTITAITDTVDITTLGEYSVVYKILTTNGITYTIERTVNVVIDDRPVFNPITMVWEDPVTGEEVDAPEPQADKIYELYKSSEDTILPEGYIGQTLRVFPLYVTEDDNTFSDLDVWTDLGVKMFRGQTGHTYIQATKKKMHNFPIKNSNVDFYLDEGLKINYASYTTDEFGLIDFTGTSNTLPELNTAETNQGNVYVNINSTLIENDVLLTDFASYIDTLKAQYGADVVFVDDAGDEIDSPEYLLAHQHTVDDPGDPTAIPPIDPSSEEYVEIKVMPYILESAIDMDNPILYFDVNGFTQKTQVYKNEDGKVEAPYLKHSRKYLVAETTLPEGYDYPEGQNPLFILNTKEYEVGVTGKSTTNGNKVRRLDLMLYKANAPHNKAVRISGALFDVWDAFEEGEDWNVIKHIKPATKFTNQKTEYIDVALGVPNVTDEDAIGLNSYYAAYPEKRFVIVDDNGDQYGSDIYKKNHTQEIEIDLVPTKVLVVEGTVYEIYQPDIKEREYLGRYISGGLYKKFEDALDGATLSVYSDEACTNKVKTFKMDEDHAFTMIGLSDGKYYYKLDRPLKPDFEPVTYEAPSGYHLDPEDNKKSINDLDETDIVNSIVITHVSSEDNSSTTVYSAPSGYHLDPFDSTMCINNLDETKTRKSDAKVYHPFDDCHVALADLPAIYSESKGYSFNKGLIQLPSLKYGHDLIFREIKAPSGYQFDDSEYRVEIKNAYGIHKVENYRVNTVTFRIMHKSGLNFEEMAKESE